MRLFCSAKTVTEESGLVITAPDAEREKQDAGHEGHAGDDLPMFGPKRDDIFEERTPMSGPIVRTGTTPKFWQNWDQVFGNKSGKKSGSTATKASASKSSKSAKKASTKSAAGKKAKKPAGKKK